MVRPGRGSASWLYRDFSSWGPRRAPGGPFDDWQGLGNSVFLKKSATGPSPVAIHVKFSNAELTVAKIAQARESFVVTTGTKLGSSAPATKVPREVNVVSIKLWNGRKGCKILSPVTSCLYMSLPLKRSHAFISSFCTERPLVHSPVFYSFQKQKSKKKKSSGCCWARLGKGGSRRFHSVNQTHSLHLWDLMIRKLRDCSETTVLCEDLWRFGGLRFQVSWVSCQEISFWSTELQDGVAKMFGWRSGPCEDYWTPRRGRIIQWHCPWLSGEGHTHLVSCTLPSPTARDWHLPPFCHLFAKLNGSCRLTANFQFQDPAAELLLIELELYGVEGHLRFLLVKRASIDSKRRHLRHTTFHAPFLPFYDSCIAPCHWRLDPISLEQAATATQKSHDAHLGDLEGWSWDQDTGILWVLWYCIGLHSQQYWAIQNDQVCELSKPWSWLHWASFTMSKALSLDHDLLNPFSTRAGAAIGFSLFQCPPKLGWERTFVNLFFSQGSWKTWKSWKSNKRPWSMPTNYAAVFFRASKTGTRNLVLLTVLLLPS